MIVKKAGSILINLDTKQIGLVHRIKNNDYSFPKGHLEDGETLLECAIRETEEETGRKNHVLTEDEITVLRYETPSGEDVECHFYICIDDGPTDKNIALKDREVLKWVNIDDVEKTVSYDNLRDFWNNIKSIINNIFPLQIH